MRRAAVLLVFALGAVSILGIAAREHRERQPVPGDEPSGPAFVHGERALGAAVAVLPLRTDARYRLDFLRTFTSLTPENAMKCDELRPREGGFDFDQADAIVDWAQRHGKRVRGHPLIWDQQLPGWLKSRHWSATELESQLREHVTRVVSHFRGRVESWDVVNEPFEDDGSWSDTLWHHVLGDGYVETALRAAHAADPGARLFLNEFAAERDGPKQDALVALAARLRRDSVPLDGIGLQSHTQAGKAPSQRVLVASMERFARLGLDVEITEMDVTLPASVADSVQADAFAQAARACRAVSRCTGLTVWGVTDATSWLGAAKRPPLFDAAGEPKPALDALLSAWR